MASANITVKNFFGLVGTGGSQNIPSILLLFVPDLPSPPGPPNIGLTTGNPTTAGTQFLGQAGVDDLFTTLNNTFSQYAIDPDPNPTTPQLLIGGNMIAVEAMLTVGRVMKSWHPGTVRPSPPMSIIKPAAGPVTQLPMCTVFTMDPASYLIINLAFYFDRWKLAQDKWDKNNPSHIDK